MENDFTSDILAAAAELAAERDKLTALLSLPEVASDGKLVVHYRKRLRASEPLLRAYAAYRESHSEEDLAAIKTEYLLLSLAEHGDAASYAGAGVCAYTRNIKDSGEKDAAFKTLVAAVGATVTIREESETYFRAEALGDKVYALLSGTGKSALGNDISFTVYPILALPEIREKDIRTDVFLNGGKGGQNVNKVETAIRMTHLPTGVTVTCRDERSQLQNKKRAAKLLRERVAEYYRAAQNALIEKAKRGDAPTKE